MTTIDSMKAVMRSLFRLLCLTSFLGVPAGAQEPRLQAVDRFIAAELARQRIPGLSVAILRGDSVLLARGYGFANLEHRVPATDSTVYQSGSVGKQFTAAAIVMLAEAGKLGLDDHITRYLPDGPPSWRAITVRHLLTHTSGIPEYTDSLVDLHRDYSEDSLVHLASTLPVEFLPGERWSYSNTGYMLLGAIIRRVTGGFYGDFLKQQIFAPLGMRTARIVSEADIVPNRSAGYRLVKGKIQNQDWVSPTLNTTADGALYFTVRDLSQWAIALNHQRTPSPAGLRASWTPVRLNNGGTYPYGFGWMVTEQRGHLRIGHTGSWQGFRGSIQRYPEYDLTIIALANLEQAVPEAVSFGIAGILEPKLLAPHLIRAELKGPRPPRPIPEVLRSIATEQDSAAVTAGLRAFSSKAFREGTGDLLEQAKGWTFLGCDEVGARKLDRLGARVTRICYARSTGKESNQLVEVLYTSDWRVADVDWYAF
jgi:CubicO group peptidase (beta-lactamase class C family)